MRALSWIGCAVVAVIVAVMVPSAHADTFTYQFTSEAPDFPGNYTFTYTSPTLITSDESGLLPSSCSALGVPCSSVSILAATGEIQIEGDNGLTVPGLPASFFNVGTNVFGYSSITITDNTGDINCTSPVPEPSTVALLGSGLLGVAGLLRRRIA